MPHGGNGDWQGWQVIAAWCACDLDGRARIAAVPHRTVVIAIGIPKQIEARADAELDQCQRLVVHLGSEESGPPTAGLIMNPVINFKAVTLK